MKTFSLGNINQLYSEVAPWIMENGFEKSGTKSGGLVCIEFTNPQNKWSLSATRKANPFVQIFEYVWVMAGCINTDLLKRYIPSADNFADEIEGEMVWRAGYGKRLFSYSGIDSFGNEIRDLDQIQAIIQRINKDPYTRRACASIWDSAKDLTIEKTKDTACNNFLDFKYRNGKLDLTLFVRSNDCFTGDTKVKLLSGKSKTLEELEKNYENEYVYSCKENGEIIPGKINKVWKTKKVTKLVKITLDNGETIKCTPEHKFMLRDGSYLEAKNLNETISLMPLYSERNKDNRMTFIDNKTGTRKKTYTMAANYYKNNHSEAKERIGIEGNKYVIIHHQDFDKTNDNPDNLIYMGNNDHKIIKIEELEVDPTWVYDIEIKNEDKTHNFALDSGIFVHNCIWGFSNANIVLFTSLLEMVAKETNLPIGNFNYLGNDLHIYERHYSKINSMSSDVRNLEDYQDSFIEYPPYDEIRSLCKKIMILESFLNKKSEESHVEALENFLICNLSSSNKNFLAYALLPTFWKRDYLNSIYQKNFKKSYLKLPFTLQQSIEIFGK